MEAGSLSPKKKLNMWTGSFYLQPNKNKSPVLITGEAETLPGLFRALAAKTETAIKLAAK